MFFIHQKIICIYILLFSNLLLGIKPCLGKPIFNTRELKSPDLQEFKNLDIPKINVDDLKLYDSVIIKDYLSPNWPLEIKKLNLDSALKRTLKWELLFWQYDKNKSYKREQKVTQYFDKKAAEIKKEIELADCDSFFKVGAITTTNKNHLGGAENVNSLLSRGSDGLSQPKNILEKESSSNELSEANVSVPNENEINIIRTYNELVIIAIGKVQRCGKLDDAITLPGNPVTPPPPPGKEITALEYLRDSFFQAVQPADGQINALPPIPNYLQIPGNDWWKANKKLYNRKLSDTENGIESLRGNFNFLEKENKFIEFNRPQFQLPKSNDKLIKKIDPKNKLHFRITQPINIEPYFKRDSER